MQKSKNRSWLHVVLATIVFWVFLVLGGFVPKLLFQLQELLFPSLLMKIPVVKTIINFLIDALCPALGCLFGCELFLAIVKKEESIALLVNCLLVLPYMVYVVIFHIANKSGAQPVISMALVFAVLLWQAISQGIKIRNR